MSQKNSSLQSQIAAILDKYPTPYPADAYAFVAAAVRYTMENLEVRRHVSARELLEGIRKLAAENYGPMGGDVLAAWEIVSGHDAGEVVYRMIEFGALSASPEDSRSEFDIEFDFSTDPRCTAPFREPMPKID